MEDSNLSVTLKVVGDDNRGIYYPNTHRVVIYLNKHESLDDLYKTINHELIHHCLNIMNETIDDDQEESLIFFMNWAEETL